MTIQKILVYGDESLRKPSKEVVKVSTKIQKIINDMFDTMYNNNGVGLAAPQIGVNYRIFVTDTAMDDQPLNPMVFINPKIIKKWGAVNSYEGCLSFPAAYTYVRRYANIIIKARDIKGRLFTLEANDGNLLSRAIQHEYDHLEGILFVDHTRNKEETNQMLVENGLPNIDLEYLIEENELEEQILKQQECGLTQSGKESE